MIYPSLSLKALRAFATVVECKSISGAARKLNVAASAVTAAVGQVEAEVGAQLLIRARARGVSPTPEAVALASQIRALFDEYSQILEDGQSQARELRGDLRIGYYAPIAPAFLPKLLGPLALNNPHLNLSFFECNNEGAQTGLLAGDLDVILFTGLDLQPGIKATELISLPPYVLAPENHPLTEMEVVPIQALEHFPIVQLDLPVARSYLHELFSAHDLTPQIAARANSTEMVRSLVGMKFGVAILNMRPRIDVSYGGDPLVTLPMQSGLPEITLQTGVAKGQVRKVVATFLDILNRWSGAADPEKVTVNYRIDTSSCL